VFTGIGNFLRARRGKKEFLALSDAERKIVFYAEDTHSWIHFNAIIKELIASGEACICYLTSDPSDPVYGEFRSQTPKKWIEIHIRTQTYLQEAHIPGLQHFYSSRRLL
jgi:hypothetical protein